MDRNSRSIVFLYGPPASVKGDIWGLVPGRWDAVVRDLMVNVGQPIRSAYARSNNLRQALGCVARDDRGQHDGDVFVIVALDRLGRPIQRLLRSVADLRRRGISLRCPDGDVDLSATSIGQAQSCIVAALVACLDTWETERARHRDKTMTERGSRPGAQPKLRTASSEDLLAMLDRPGANHTSVAQELGVGRTTLYRHLKRTSASG